jgi:hypothetical protein
MMQQLTVVLLLSAAIFLPKSPVIAQQANVQIPMAESPELVLREFYKWYIHTLRRNVDPLKSGKVTMRKYVSLRFMREMEKNEKLPEGEGFDADYFLQTQEYDSVTDKLIVISRVSVRGTIATAVVTLDDGYPKVKVTLKQESGAWKIDNVKNAPDPPKDNR